MIPAEFVTCCVRPFYVPFDGMRCQLSDVISGCWSPRILYGRGCDDRESATMTSVTNPRNTTVSSISIALPLGQEMASLAANDRSSQGRSCASRKDGARHQ